MQLLFIHTCIIFALYILSAFSTTGIQRLLSDCEISVLSSACFCPKCKQPIPLKCQIPIFSYFANKGTCQNCGSPIPKTDLFLEIFLFTSMTFITVWSRFSWTGFFLDLMLFECTRFCFMMIFGIRKTRFIQEFCKAMLLDLMVFLLLAFLFLLSSLL